MVIIALQLFSLKKSHITTRCFLIQG